MKRSKRIRQEIFKIIEDILTALAVILLWYLFWKRHDNPSIGELAQHFILMSISKIVGRYIYHYWKTLLSHE